MFFLAIIGDVLDFGGVVKHMEVNMSATTQMTFPSGFSTIFPRENCQGILNSWQIIERQMSASSKFAALNPNRNWPKTKTICWCSWREANPRWTEISKTNMQTTIASSKVRSPSIYFRSKQILFFSLTSLLFSFQAHNFSTAFQSNECLNLFGPQHVPVVGRWRGLTHFDPIGGLKWFLVSHFLLVRSWWIDWFRTFGLRKMPRRVRKFERSRNSAWRVMGIRTFKEFT